MNLIVVTGLNSQNLWTFDVDENTLDLKIIKLLLLTYLKIIKFFSSDFDVWNPLIEMFKRDVNATVNKYITN